jgi:kynurenine/2-aminoadipate aminotransferase
MLARSAARVARAGAAPAPRRGLSAAAAAAATPDYASYFTPLSAARRPSPIRALQPLTSLPGMISLAGGMPNPKLFPVSGIAFTLNDSTRLELPRSDVVGALQYSPTPGLPELVDRLTRMQVGEHKPPRDVAVTVTPGSQDGLAKLFDALVTSEDTLLIEAPTYSGSLALVEPIGCRLAAVPTDEGGLRPEALAAMLDGWDARAQGRKPRVLLTIPTGGNPTGASLSLERKRALYAVARAHDLLIIEDSPYYYLSYAPTREASLLSMDTDGRVVRTDSFSKILSAGIRVGFLTGPPAIIERVNLHNQASIMHCSGLSQAMVLALLRHWRAGEAAGAGAGGGAASAPSSGGSALGAAFEAHLASVRAFYSAQCDAFLAAADRHLRANADGTGELLAEFGRPSAGMFIWMKLRGVEDSFSLITKEAAAAKVLLVPGAAFLPGCGTAKTPYVRAAFSTASFDEMATALERLGGLLRARRSG